MVNRKKTYLNIALFSLIIAFVIAIFSDARSAIAFNSNSITYVSSITFILSIIQAIIIIYNEINELRNLSFAFYVSFKVIVDIKLTKPLKEKLSAIYSRKITHIQLQVIRC